MAKRGSKPDAAGFLWALLPASVRDGVRVLEAIVAIPAAIQRLADRIEELEAAAERNREPMIRARPSELYG